MVKLRTITLRPAVRPVSEPFMPAKRWAVLCPNKSNSFASDSRDKRRIDFVSLEQNETVSAGSRMTQGYARTYADTFDAAIRLAKKYPETHWCYGNHELGYLWGRKDSSEYYPSAEGIVKGKLRELQRLNGASHIQRFRRRNWR